MREKQQQQQKTLNVIKSLTKCAIKCRLHRIICKKCHIHIHICIKYKAASMQKPRAGYLHQSKTLQSERVCLPHLTHPLAHINIAQAPSSPLSYISDVAKCHDSPLYASICKRLIIAITT